ncbi:hypothetical protein PFISCL1PPCAC_20976, partial [Pristionchus fissidentatus]
RELDSRPQFSKSFSNEDTVEMGGLPGLSFGEIAFDYALDDKITLEATIKVKNVHGIRIPVFTDFSIPRGGSDDVILRVADKEVHTSKNFLAVHSPVFHTMFFGNIVEENKEEIEI